MGNQYLLVPLSYNDETACPKSHKGPRSHVGFELWPADVSFCACTIGSCFSHASFPSISFCPESFCHSRPLAAAGHARCCLQCVTTGDVSPYRVCPQISGGDKAASCSSVVRPVWAFLWKTSEDEDKDNKVSGETLTLLQLNVTSQLS